MKVENGPNQGGKRPGPNRILVLKLNNNSLCNITVKIILL